MIKNVSQMPNYLEKILEYLEKPTRTVLGLHSGSSADGPTAVIAHISGTGANTKIEPIAHESFNYDSPLKERIFDLFNRETGTVDRIAQADNAIGEFFSQVAKRIVQKANLSFADIDLIASSGQVTYQVIEGQRDDHKWLGNSAITSFLDLGAGAVIAENTGVNTVSNLRQRDIAAGGLGIPLVTYGDWAIFRHPKKGRIIQNIGGIANPTVIPPAANIEDVFAFDTGPGNMIIDALMRKITGGKKSFDESGNMAAAGKVHEGLLKTLMAHPFLKKTPPKGAAHQLFGSHFAYSIYKDGRGLGLNDEDIIATVTEFTVETIVLAYEKFIAPRAQVDEILVAGGGAYNNTIMERLVEKFSPLSVETTEVLGIPVDIREVLTMVVIANETIHGKAGNATGATGASHSVISGDITPGGLG